MSKYVALVLPNFLDVDEERDQKDKRASSGRIQGSRLPLADAARWCSSLLLLQGCDDDRSMKAERSIWGEGTSSLKVAGSRQLQCRIELQ